MRDQQHEAGQPAADAALCLMAWVVKALSLKGAPFALQALEDMQSGAAHVTVACELSSGQAVMVCQLSRGAELHPLGQATVLMGLAPGHLN